MDALSTYESVCEKLQVLKLGALIGIEGFCSAGKSRLADRLAADLDADVIHTDSFAMKFDRPPPYLDCLDLRGLTLTLAGRDKSKYCVVEGICLRDALASCNARADFYIYLRRIGRSGLWHDSIHLEDFENSDPIGADEVEPHLSDFRYHARVRPHELADAVIERFER